MANTRERVKDFPSIVGTIQSDDYIPVDGATQGVRKAQVKDIMDAPITGLDTIANTTKGAINELATTAGKVWVGTQDEYDDLPDTKLTDNVLHCITDGEPSAYDSIWDKVGTDPLDTTASDCSGAINELKQSLFKLQVYSTAKFDTGKKWIDGKTIWGKVYTGYAVSNSTVDLDTIIIDTIIHGYGWARSENNNSWCIPSGRQDGYENRPLYNTNTHKLSVQFGSAYLNGTLPFVFTIEFTE